MEDEKPVAPVIKKANVNDILNSITELNKQNILSVYVPSLESEINFKPLTVKQQKLILSTGVDTEIENLAFANAMNDIILENCLAQKEMIKITDKSAILLQLRQKAVGDKIKITEQDKDYIISIDEQIQKVRSKTVPQSKFSIEDSGVKITGSVPGLKLDTRYNRIFTRNTKKTGKNTQITLSDLVGDIFVHEMVKYVDTISIGDNILQLDGSIDANQAINIFESLPMNISLKVAEEIKASRVLEIETITSDNLPEDVQISIDASLFTDE